MLGTLKFSVEGGGFSVVLKMRTASRNAEERRRWDGHLSRSDVQSTKEAAYLDGS